MYIHIYYICVFIIHLSIYLSIYLYTYIHIQLYLCMYIYMYIYSYIYVCIYIYVYIYVYIYIYMHFCHFLYIVTFIMFIYFLKTVQSFHVIFSDNFLVLLWPPHIKKTSEFFTAYFRDVFYLLRAVKPFLIKVCKDAFCITPMLTALRKIFTANPLVEAILGYFLVCLVVFFSISLEPFGFL